MKKTGKFLSLVLGLTVALFAFCHAPAAAASRDDLLEKKIDDTLSCVNPTMPAIEKVLAVHNELIKDAHYDYSNYLSNTLSADDFTAYGILVNHTGVCDGYADAYRLLMNRLGIPTIAVCNSTHAWDIVYLGGNWYHIDVTWDDPIQPNGSDSSTPTYTYFMMSDSKTAKSHGSPWYCEHTGISSPKASDTRFDQCQNIWDTLSHSDLCAIQAPIPTTVTLDTSAYSTYPGAAYSFLAKSNIGEFIKAHSSDPSVVSVAKPRATSSGWLIQITALKPGNATITAVSACGVENSFPVTVSQPAFTCDTTKDFTVRSSSTYQFKVTTPRLVQFVCGSPNFRVISTVKSENDYFVKVKAVGNVGTTCGFYINGSAVPVVHATISPTFPFTSDTHGTLSVRNGKTYQFKITSEKKPSFACGSSSFRLVSSSKTGNSYFIKVKAVGRSGGVSGFYVNGSRIAIGVIN